MVVRGGDKQQRKKRAKLSDAEKGQRKTVKNDWIIKKQDAPSTANLLSLPVANKAYYRDVHVWLPDVRWGDLKIKVNRMNNKLTISSREFQNYHRMR